MDPARCLALALVLFAACSEKDPVEGATHTTETSAGSTSEHSGGGSTQTASSSDAGTTTEPTGTDTESSGATTDSSSGTSGPPTSSTGPSGPVPGYAADIQPIWNTYCLSACHEAGGTGAAWLILVDDSGYSDLVGAASLSFPSLTLVVPGDLENSYLWYKLNNTQTDVGGGTSPMPQPPEEPLGAVELDLIAAWIAGGAPP